MGKVLVLVDSQGGNTQAMARLVAHGAESVAGTEVRLLTLDQAAGDDIVWCNGLALGSPTHLGLPSWRMKKFWDELVNPLWGKIDGRIGCAFSSSGGWGGGSELACQSLLGILINYGFLVFGVTDYVAPRFTLHYGAVVAGEPRSEGEVASCLRLGERLATWVRILVDNEKSRQAGGAADPG
jgi:NAD(P)H dehydrogenase (quinone)